MHTAVEVEAYLSDVRNVFVTHRFTPVVDCGSSYAMPDGETCIDRAVELHLDAHPEESDWSGPYLTVYASDPATTHREAYRLTVALADVGRAHGLYLAEDGWAPNFLDARLIVMSKHEVDGRWCGMDVLADVRIEDGAYNFTMRTKL